MLRNKNLIPLSHQHQHALALCVRIERAAPIAEENIGAWQAEMAQQFRQEIMFHFKAEEEILFPAACRFDELVPLVHELVAEHHSLRKQFAAAEDHAMTPATLVDFAHTLSAHIRKEERQLFERLQQLLDEEQLAEIGTRLNEVLAEASGACVLPTEATRLRSTKR